MNQQLRGGTETGGSLGSDRAGLDFVFVRVFPSENGLHQLGGIDVAAGERPIEAFSSAELGGRAPLAAMTPQEHKTADRPGAPLEPGDKLARSLFTYACRRQCFRALDKPFHEDARFHIA